MHKPIATIPERLEIIKACQASGLSVAEWCRRNGLNDNTYFNWVTRLRKKGLLETPAVIPQVVADDPVQQDVVKVKLVAGQVNMSSAVSAPVPVSSLPDQSGSDAVMELILGTVRIKVTNQINPQLLADTIRIIGGVMGC